MNIRNMFPTKEMQSDLKLLQLLLHPQDPEKARLLLHEFGSLKRIYQAEISELTAVISVKNALRIKAGFEIGNRLMKPNIEKRTKITRPSEVADLVQLEMSLLDHEELWVLILNTRNEVLKIEKLYKGGVNTIHIRVGEIFSTAIKLKSPSIIVVHNHPSGDFSPSPEDIQITRQLVNAGELLNIKVEDHLIIANNRYCSMRERGLGFK